MYRIANDLTHDRQQNFMYLEYEGDVSVSESPKMSRRKVNSASNLELEGHLSTKESNLLTASIQTEPLLLHQTLGIHYPQSPRFKPDSDAATAAHRKDCSATWLNPETPKLCDEAQLHCWDIEADNTNLYCRAAACVSLNTYRYT